MTLTRWQRPELSNWRDLGRWSTLRDQFDRLFDLPLADSAQSSPFFSGWMPAIDLYEDGENVIVRAELPGMQKEDIDVSLHDGALVIAGERKLEEKHRDAETYRSERLFGKFQRSITLPTPVDAGKVKAAYKDGILTVTLPKTEEAKPKHIEVNVK